MEKREVFKLIAEKRTKDYYEELANGFILNKQNLNALIDLMTEEEHPINFRAAYLLDIINVKSPDLVDAYKDNLIEKLAYFGSDSVKRHVLKILATSKTLEAKRAVNLFDFCIRIILAPKEKVAAKVHAMQLMNSICMLVPDLKEEAIEVISSQTERNSVAFFARAKKVLVQLKKLS